MKQVAIKVSPRVKTGKEVAKKLRKEGLIPAILYGKGVEPRPFSLRYADFERIYKRYKGEALIYTLEFENGESSKVQAVLKELQRDPVTDLAIHLDFQAISEDETIEVKVPLELVGKPVGLTKGGILEVMLHEITIECLPKDIPDKLVVDISSLDIGHSLHVADIKAPAGVKITEDPEETVATMVAEEEEKGPSEETSA